MMNANKYLKNTKVIPVTWDKMIVKKPIENPVIWDVKSHAIKQKDKQRPEMKVNLRDTSLRTKGIAEKENIVKKYDKDVSIKQVVPEPQPNKEFEGNNKSRDDGRDRRKKETENSKKKDKREKK